MNHKFQPFQPARKGRTCLRPVGSLKTLDLKAWVDPDDQSKGIIEGYFAIQTKSEDQGIAEIYGYANVTGHKDAHDEIIDPGAFRRTLDQNDGRVALLWFHMPWEPIGNAYLKEDAKGLYGRYEIDLDIPEGRRVFSGVQKGYIDSFSIGFIPVVVEYDKETDTLHIKEVKLLEVSLITRGFAANDLAKVEAWRNGDDISPKTHREFSQQISKRMAEIQALLDEAADSLGLSTPQHSRQDPPRADLTLSAKAIQSIEEAQAALSALTERLKAGNGAA